MAGNLPDHKATNEEMQSRIDQAAKWIIQNPDATAKAFTDWFEAKFDLQTRMAFKYRKWAFDALGDDKYNTNVEGARRAAIASLKQMFEEAEGVKEKLAIRQEINKISGLYTQKIEVEQKSDIPLFKIDLNTGNTSEE